MQFIFTGFSQITGFRVFAYQSIGDDKTKTKLAVRADMGLGRKHGIQLQEWPLLCREMLEQRTEDIERGYCELIFDEDRMRRHTEARVATRLAALAKRKAPRPAPRVSPEASALRTPPVFSTAAFAKRW